MTKPGPTDPAAVAETAWAKINLTLSITGRRADGYHELSSLTVFADYGDALHFAESDALDLVIDGPFAAGLSASADNLVLAAAAGLADLAGRPLQAAITLTKNLPVAAGIGGGSADAAAALRGLCRLFDLSPEPADLQRFALRLGADVPVCLASRPAMMSGVGERLRPVADLPSFALVMVNPGVPLSTAAVFQARRADFSQQSDQGPPADLDALLGWLSSRPNDLQAAAKALRPEIAQVLDSLSATAGCRLSLMSGSGATCLGLYGSVPEAQAAAETLESRQPGWWVRATALRPPSAG